VNDLAPLDPIQEGDCRVRISARSAIGPIDSELRITLTPHPKVVIPRKQLPKGHRITIQDLEMQSIPQDEVESDFVLDPAEVVGLEVHGFPRPGRPLSHSDLGMPTLIRRGDLIEVRVMGGGVMVTTNAKAHDHGAANDLIEIETLEPRKRLLARVVQPGLVEIVTRAPKVQP
jgi:flagella basal body P-ring formation protein FlgA